MWYVSFILLVVMIVLPASGNFQCGLSDDLRASAEQRSERKKKKHETSALSAPLRHLMTNTWFRGVFTNRLYEVFVFRKLRRCYIPADEPGEIEEVVACGLSEVCRCTLVQASECTGWCFNVSLKLARSARPTRAKREGLGKL